MTDVKQDVSKDDFIKEMEKFENDTARKILELMEEEEYMLPVAVLGLISVVRALIENFGNDALRDEATHFLNLNTEDFDKMPTETEAKSK